MFRAHLTDGDILCTDYEHEEMGVELFDDDGEFLAFVPYANLLALMNEDLDRGDEPAIAD